MSAWVYLQKESLGTSISRVLWNLMLSWFLCKNLFSGSSLPSIRRHRPLQNREDLCCWICITTQILGITCLEILCHWALKQNHLRMAICRQRSLLRSRLSAGPDLKLQQRLLHIHEDNFRNLDGVCLRFFGPTGNVDDPRDFTARSCDMVKHNPEPDLTLWRRSTNLAKCFHLGP